MKIKKTLILLIYNVFLKVNMKKNTNQFILKCSETEQIVHRKGSTNEF